MEHNQKKKILFLITKSNWGGAQRYIYDLATTLDPTRYTVVVALGGDGPLVTKLQEAHIRTIPINGLIRDISLTSEIRATWAIGKIIRTEKPDVLHVNSSKAGAFGTFLGRILRVHTIIFTAHGWAFNEDRPHWQKTILKAIHWVTVLFSHKTIAVSSAIKKQMNWPGVQKKIVVINPGRTLQNILPKEEARGILETKVSGNTKPLASYHTNLWVGTIAELHPIKQLHRAIDAIGRIKNEVPNIRYIIIGSGECESQLRKQVYKQNLEEYVYFTGSIHEAARLLPAFDVFVLPSASEAYGYVLLEAGLAGVPVLATNVGGVPDIITDGKTGLLVPVAQTGSFTTALQKMLTNTALRTQLSHNLAESVQGRTVTEMTKQTAILYT